MKTLLFLFILSFHSIVSAQITDDFSISKTDFNTYWNGDTNSFEIISGKLKLNAPIDNNQVIIYRKFRDTTNLIMKMTCSMDFAPSSSNKLQLLLTDDEKRQNGFLLEIGETGSEDKIKCYEITNGSLTLLTEGNGGSVNNAFENLNLVFTLNDSLKLTSTLSNEKEKIEFTTFRETTIKLNCISIICNYTSTRSDKFSFDNLSIYPLLSIKNDTSDQEEIKNYQAKIHDVLFSELMIDPSPKRFLPEKEYIELYNNSDSFIQLKNWIITNGSSTNTLDSFLLPPHQTIIICDENDKNEFTIYNNTLTVKALVTLSNTDFLLSLRSPTNELIHEVNYDINKNYSPKKSGGYSYELIDNNQPCLSQSWTFSENELGSTLGYVNFIKKDETVPHVHNYRLINDSITLITNIQNKNSSYYNKKIKVSSTSKNAEINLQTCNSLSSDTIIELSATYSSGQLIFNEILTNSLDDCPEFIELYNNSQDFIKIEDVYLGYSSTGDIPEEIIPIPQGLIIPPHTYLVLSTDINQLKKFYIVNKACVLVELNIPPLLNDEGYLFLVNVFGEITSSIGYNKSQHNNLLEVEKGISLERINYDHNEWTSANATKGGASVGQKNDAFSLNEVDKIKIKASENHFSLSVKQPVTYTIILEDGNYFGDIIIFSKNGRKIKTLYENIQFTAEDEVIIDQLSFLDNLGIYIIYFEFRHPEKGISRKKIPLVIIE